MQHLFHLALTTRALPIWSRYAATILLVLLACALALTLGEGMHSYSLLIFVPVVLVTGIFFDRGNSIVATLLSAVLAIYFFLPPRYSLAIESPNDFIGVVIYIAVGLFVAVKSHIMKRLSDFLENVFGGGSRLSGAYAPHRLVPRATWAARKKGQSSSPL